MTICYLGVQGAMQLNDRLGRNWEKESLNWKNVERIGSLFLLILFLSFYSLEEEDEEKCICCEWLTGPILWFLFFIIKGSTYIIKYIYQILYPLRMVP